VSPCHSISIGFDAVPAGRAAFDFPALTYYAERTSDRAALITLFPIGGNMRANLFVYRDMQDPWLQAIRTRPQETLFALWPGLRKIMGDFTVGSPVQIRPVDLYVTQGHRQGGVVLVGDAFATSCPAAGTGARKVLFDVERLCNVHIPQWLATPGMHAAKIAAFYDDPIKQASDTFARDKAFTLRALSTDDALAWRVRRLAKFVLQYAVGTLRRLGLYGDRADVPRSPDVVVAERDVTLVPSAPLPRRVNEASTQTVA
jgi:2-polyprenyl-6-methoxyphenol hydroxylase-like FAD-dependent oxidoreductase